jgi:hypothetical protein
VAIYVRAVSKTAAPAASPAPPAPAPPAAGAAPAQGAAAPPAPPARPTYSWDTIHVIEIPADGKLARAIMLAPGAYDVYIGVRERVAPAPGSTPAPGKMGLLRREVTVPALGGADPQTSSVILARAFEQLPAPLSAEKQEENPYVFGTLKLVPSLDHVFSKTGNLTVMFWIYNVSQTAGKPDVVVDFSFSQKQPDGSFKYINRTKPQPMNAETLPADFNLTAGHQLLSSLVIGLKSFAEGEWRIEIKVTDKMSGKLLTKEVDFQVSA